MKKILICDDNIFIRETLRVFLSDISGLAIDYAEDGKVALDMISHNRYDLIVMDLQMPFFSGVELIRMIREVNHLDMPIIVLTGKANDETLVDKLMELHVDGLFSKPFSPKQLIGRIESLLSSHVAA